jgi:pyruvate dehydrogenase (quinone)
VLDHPERSRCGAGGRGASPCTRHGALLTGLQEARIVPHPGDLKQAAEILNSGEKVAMLVGAGALGATDAVVEVAEVLGAGVAKALLGKAAVPDDLPFVTGSIGLLGTKPAGR